MFFLAGDGSVFWFFEIYTDYFFFFFDDAEDVIDPDAGHGVVGVEFEVVEFIEGYFGFCGGAIDEVECLIA